MRAIPPPDLPQADVSEAARVGHQLAEGVRAIRTTYGVLMTLEYRRGTFATDPNDHLDRSLANAVIIISSSQLDWFYPAPIQALS